jgi:hypothetical protein
MATTRVLNSFFGGWCWSEMVACFWHQCPARALLHALSALRLVQAREWAIQCYAMRV